MKSCAHDAKKNDRKSTVASRTRRGRITQQQGLNSAIELDGGDLSERSREPAMASSKERGSWTQEQGRGQQSWASAVDGGGELDLDRDTTGSAHGEQERAAPTWRGR